jgi:hypothetical protein
MKQLRYYTVFALVILIGFNLQAQDKFGLRIKVKHRDDSGIGYNFFLGDDAADFQTTIMGFGSGFLFDVLTSRQSIDLLQLGTGSFNISVGGGVAINKYRFSDNLVLDKSSEDGMVHYLIDPDENHDYVNTFFGYGKSKLVTASLFVPAHLNFDITEKFVFSAGGFVDFYVYGKHKRKFLMDGEKQKEMIKPAEFKDYNLNKVKYGISASLIHKKSGMGISGAYYLTPFFQEGMGPDLTEARISLVIGANPKLINK